MNASPPAVVVGTGFGCRIHVPALRAAGFEVKALVGVDPERTARRAEKLGVPLALTDLDEAIARTGAVAVTIASPPSSHARLTLAAIARGCHVICEKPLSMNLGEARAMLEAAERAGVTHLVGNEFRWLPERAIVARAVAEGLIGAPRFLSLLTFHGLVADPETKMPRWWFDEAAGGGWLGAQGSHIVDQVRTWVGDIDSLSAALLTVSARPPGAEDSYALRFRLKNGAEGVVQQSAGAWGPQGAFTRLAGEHGSLWIEGGKVFLADRSGTRELTTPPDLELPAPPDASDDPRARFSQFELGPYTRLCEVFRQGVEGRDIKSATPPPTFRDGVACMEAMDAIRRSAAEGGTVVRIGAGD